MAKIEVIKGFIFADELILEQMHKQVSNTEFVSMSKVNVDSFFFCCENCTNAISSNKLFICRLNYDIFTIIIRFDDKRVGKSLIHQ